MRTEFARDREQPHGIETRTDRDALENGSDSIAMWTGTVGLIMMRETNNTLGNNTNKMGTLMHGEDISPGKGIDGKMSHDIKTIGHRTGQGHRMDYEEDRLE